MKYWVLISIFSLFAQYEDEQQFIGVESALPQNLSPMTLVASKPSLCPGQNESEKEGCEVVVFYEENVGLLQILKVDGRRPANDGYDVTQAIRYPEHYRGKIQSVDLKKIFESSEKIESVSAYFMKGKKLKIKVKQGREKKVKDVLVNDVHAIE